MPDHSNKTPIQIDRETFTPLTPIPTRLRHKLLFQLALFWIGEAVEDGVKLSTSLRDRVRARLKEFCATYFSDAIFDSALDHTATNALEATVAGNNNLYAFHSRALGDRFTFRL